MNRVLLVDDNAERLDALAAGLEAGPWTIRKARCGDSALKTIAKFKPNLMVLDAEMAEMGDFALLRRLSKDHRYANIPVILIAAPEEQARCLASGAADCVTKPADTDVVAARIANRLADAAERHARDEHIAALQDRVSGRTAELVSLRKRLNLINDSKDLAMKLIVRELSAPATGIAGLARVAILEMKDEDKRERLSGLLNGNLETMDRLIANVEYLGTLKTGLCPARLPAVDVAPLVAMAIEKAKGRLGERNLETVMAFPQETAELPLHPELFTQMITPILRLVTAIATASTLVKIEIETCVESAAIAVRWASDETNQGILASVTDFGPDILRSITSCGLVTEICLAEKIARICGGTVVWDLRDPENACCTVQFDRPGS